GQPPPQGRPARRPRPRPQRRHRLRDDGPRARPGPALPRAAFGGRRQLPPRAGGPRPDRGAEPLPHPRRPAGAEALPFRPLRHRRPRQGVRGAGPPCLLHQDRRQARAHLHRPARAALPPPGSRGCGHLQAAAAVRLGRAGADARAARLRGLGRAPPPPPQGGARPPPRARRTDGHRAGLLRLPPHPRAPRPCRLARGGHLCPL
ncbi:MAG: Ribonuclease D related protein, partial [uncultured Rubellimicrobium sp.]